MFTLGIIGSVGVAAAGVAVWTGVAVVPTVVVGVAVAAGTIGVMQATSGM